MKKIKTICNQQWTKQCISSIQDRSEAIACVFLFRAVRFRIDAFEPALSSFTAFLYVVVMVLCSTVHLCFVNKVSATLRLRVGLQTSPWVLVTSLLTLTFCNLASNFSALLTFFILDVLWQHLALFWCEASIRLSSSSSNPLLSKRIMRSKWISTTCSLGAIGMLN